jgi:hypothetical protein
MPIDVDDSQTRLLAQTFGCKVGGMPLTYLGLPLGTTRPTINEFSPSLTRIENRLKGISKLLPCHGKVDTSEFYVLITFNLLNV